MPGNVPFSHKWETQAANCVRILHTVCDALKTGTPADKTLAKIYRENRCYGSRDKQFFHKAVFAYFRWLGWLQISGFTKPEDKLLAALILDGPDDRNPDSPLPPAAQVWAGEKWDDVLQILKVTDFRKRFSYWTGTDAPPLSKLIPDWAVHALADGAEERFLPMLTSRSPIWVRVVPGREEAVMKEWQNAGLTFERHPRIRNAFCFKNTRIRFEDFPSWKNGWFEMQDFSSQCIGYAANASTGGHWFDPCAGGGGKSLQLAAAVGKTGSVSVYDVRSFKLDVLEERASRTPFARQIIRQNRFPETGTFDGILIDAPCSSSGRWRRNSDARFSTKDEIIAEVNQIQWDLLKRCAKLVRPGGRLVYGTCSVFVQENARTAKRFLEEFSGEFEPMPFPSPHTGEMIPGGMLQTFPADADCDGSFVAVFRRKER